MDSVDEESQKLSPEEEFTPEFKETAQRIHDYFLEYVDVYIEDVLLNPEEPDIFSLDVPLKRPRLLDENQQKYIWKQVTEAAKTKELEIRSIDFSSEEAVMILVKNPKPRELEPEEMEIPSPVTEYETPEEITKRERENSEYRSQGEITFKGSCSYCGEDYEVTAVYLGKKPKVKKGKKTFDLDYGNICCSTPNCVNSVESGIYAGKPHEVILFYRHKAESEEDAKKWIGENIEKNK